MSCITKELASQMEGCIKQTHIEVTKEYAKGCLLEVHGGAACFSGFDSYLSQVVGWGFTTAPKQFKSDIEQIENFYKKLNHSRVDIEFCPFVGGELAAFLNKRGYLITELNNVSLLDLSTYKLIELDSRIREVKPDELHEWSTQVALGFEYPDAQEQFFHYARAKGATAFAVYDQAKIIAGAVIAVHGDFCDLGVTSTLPAYRGRGLQKKLLHARLNYAKEHGLSWAMVTTEPGTISDANVQKTGFHCAYTRIKMTLRLS